MKARNKAGRTLTRAELKMVTGGKTTKALLCGPRCHTGSGAAKCTSLGCTCDESLNCIP